MQMSDFPPDTFKIRTVEAGDVIFLEGQPADNAYVILRGIAEVVVQDAAGETIPINRMKPGELFGELAILTDAKVRTATVMAAEKCELIEIKRDVFEGRLGKADPLLRFMLDHVSRRLVKLTEKVIGENNRR